MKIELLLIIVLIVSFAETQTTLAISTGTRKPFQRLDSKSSSVYSRTNMLVTIALIFLILMECISLK
ncbi:hypothetical protein U8527_10675 [Kordia algicida OT-1]|uniref:Uncharacterized protein n=1 Tax=Kordia algicida OT-1 TaxID=391587 RepID=A9ECU8_9FLAO|nr:hypothetical protein [Kordia algicida]EDP94316.1 hypothetical protein KAOT1_04165 [Kordia algicida OT-1]